MRRIRSIALMALAICAVFSLGIIAETAAAIPKSPMPVLFTSAGQCPQLDVLSMVADLAKVKYDLSRMPSVAMLAKGVGMDKSKNVTVNTDLKKYPYGTPYKAVFITMGASMKGMGAAGIDSDFENKRVEEVVSWFRKQGLFMVGVHVAGEDRRYHYLSEGMIDRVAPYCNLLIIANDSNKDGRFTKISNEKKIQMVLIDTEFDMVDILAEMFK